MTAHKIDLLLIEDNAADARLLELALEGSQFRTHKARNLESALNHLFGASVDIVLSDLSLPDASGLECIQLLTAAAPTVPIVVVTGAKDEETGLSALRAGAQDYIFKDDAKGSLLPRALRYAIERKQAEQRMIELAQQDSLTGLANRVQFRTFLDKAVARAERQGRSVALMFVDLDRFKMVNDTHGQEVGDHVLKTVAERMTECLRKSDLAARIGADEFAVVMEFLESPQTVSAAAQRVLDAVSRPFRLGARQIHATTSIGVAIYPTDADTSESLMSSAHTAMARAKERGKNTYQFYTREMHERALKQLELERTLRGAMERGEFLLHYQPQVDMRQGRIVGFEALLRWQHPERGMVPPGEFIDFCEESGLIVPLGKWVLRSACEQQRRWRALGLPPVHIAVNVSARQLQDGDLVRAFEDVVEDTGADPGLLDVELTESAMLKDPDSVGRLLQGFTDMGMGIALDDFGTGYSSLTHLRRFSVTTIKIDRSFITNLCSSQDDAAIVSAIVGMGRSLRLRTLAEGIETSEQLAFLRQLNCDSMQGYYFSKPLPAEAVTNELFERNLYDLEPAPSISAAGAD
ncbi:MAG: EAL domain-containing protein [Kiloniellales bacterium]|nr:EAL domain-containing protein [Kiloniellales bacterium]